MVGVALFADRKGEDVLGARGLAGFNEFLDGLRLGNVREGIVRVKDEGFDGVGEAVHLALVRGGLHADFVDGFGCLRAQLNRGDGGVLDEVTDPVVGREDHVGAIAGLIRGDEVRLRVGRHDLHGNGHTVCLAPLGCGVLEGVGLLLIGPDDEVGVGTFWGLGLIATRAAVRGARGVRARFVAATCGEGSSADGCCACSEESLAANLHRVLL